MLRACLSLFISFIFTSLCHAQTFEFNDNCRQAYNHIIALNFKAAEPLLQQERKTNPKNLIPVYLDNYIDFLNVYITDTRQLYEEVKSNKDLRMEELKAGDRESPYNLFCAAEMSLQWAALHIKFGNNIGAVFEIRKAYKFLEENQSRFPDFKPNKKTLGALQALIGSVPDKYKWGVNLLGMEGSVEKGMNELKQLIEYSNSNDFIFREETITYYSLLLFHLNDDKEKAWQVLVQNGFPKQGSLMEMGNLMNLYVCAHVGIYGKHNDEALKMLNERFPERQQRFPAITYLNALGKLNKLDSDADWYFKMFLAEYKGENHIKSAYQKIAWGYLLKGDTINYQHFIKKVLKVGATTVEADKQAQKEAESKRIPNVTLLRARLLFDGGYYDEAAKIVSKLSESAYVSTEDATEYLYRSGRIYHALGNTDSAISYYDKAISKGKNLPRYFAANSAFQSGELYEAKGDKEKARLYYNMCLSFDNHEYKNGLDQKAKAALNRLQ